MQHRHLALTADFQIVLGNDHSQAAEMTLASGDGIGGPENRHRGADQWLLVMSGEGAAVVEGQSAELRPGTLLLIEQGEWHEIRNTGLEPLRTVTFYVPPAYTSEGQPLPRGESA